MSVAPVANDNGENLLLLPALQHLSGVAEGVTSAVVPAATCTGDVPHVSACLSPASPDANGEGEILLHSVWCWEYCLFSVCLCVYLPSAADGICELLLWCLRLCPSVFEDEFLISGLQSLS